MADEVKTAAKPAARNTESVSEKLDLPDPAELAQEHVEEQLEQLREEAKGKDDVSGPADNFSGDQSKDPIDHVDSLDPYKRAFPPGPDNPKHSN